MPSPASAMCRPEIDRTCCRPEFAICRVVVFVRLRPRSPVMRAAAIAPLGPGKRRAHALGHGEAQVLDGGAETFQHGVRVRGEWLWACQAKPRRRCRRNTPSARSHSRAGMRARAVAAPSPSTETHWPGSDRGGVFLVRSVSLNRRGRLVVYRAHACTGAKLDARCP